VNLRVELTDGGIVIEATDLHPTDYDVASRHLRDLTIDLQRALQTADDGGA
jgi:hypothetical protein